MDQNILIALKASILNSAHRPRSRSAESCGSMDQSILIALKTSILNANS